MFARIARTEVEHRPELRVRDSDLAPAGAYVRDAYGIVSGERKCFVV
jgi:hypothetical protein